MTTAPHTAREIEQAAIDAESKPSKAHDVVSDVQTAIAQNLMDAGYEDAADYILGAWMAGVIRAAIRAQP